MLRLRHAETEYLGPEEGSQSAGVFLARGIPLGAPAPEICVALYWPRGVPFLPPQGLAAGVAARVEVNHGRWIVNCPFCTGAQFASPSDRRFFCIDCLHAGTDAEGRWVKVIWPREAGGIEEALLARPKPANRNWMPGESADALRAETIERTGAH